jgi:hypothetical protein
METNLKKEIENSETFDDGLQALKDKARKDWQIRPHIRNLWWEKLMDKAFN